MKIELLPPFSLTWRNGYLVVNPENRKNVVLFNSEQDRTTISYARYLMSVHLGYVVPNEYEVDHINNDKTDDRIENLQLLTQQENISKENKLKTIYYEFICPICKNNFSLTGKQLGQRRDKINPCCGVSCGNIKKSITLTNNNLTP